MKRVRSTCPYCGVGCGLIAEVEGGRLAAVSGDPLHPVNRGATCVKPLHLPDAVHSADRATAPLLRASRDERWREASWRSAVAGLARRLRALVAEHGPDAVAFYISGQLLTEDYYVVNKLAKGFLGTNNVDSNSRLCMSSAVAGYRESLGSDGPPASYADVDHADCLLLLGSNTAACHPILWARIRRRQAEGACVIVVDPRRTETAAAADLHLAVRPGSDLPLLNAMLGVLDRDGLLDELFLARRAEGLEEALAGAAEWSPERAAESCGVPAEQIVEAARRFGQAKRAMALWSMGANQSTVGTLKNRALNNLCLATGNIGRQGSGPLSLTGQPNAMGGRETGGLSTLLPGYRAVDSPEDRAEMRRLWALPVEAPGISPQPGLASTELVEALETGQVRAVWIVATNPVVSQPDAERFAAALDRAELVVVQDAYHPTETGALAHVVLPAAQWPEKDGTMTNSERRVSLVQRALQPPGHALADWEIFARVARALGHRDAFAWRSASEVFDEYAAMTSARVCDVSGLSHDRLRREGPIQWPCPARGPDGEGHSGTERLYANGPFPTPSGRARLAATPHTDPVDAPDGDFPLVLTTGRLAGQWHTMTRTAKSPALLAADAEPFVELHAADARRAGVRDGQRVRISSRRGEAHLRARVSESIPEGTAFAPFHWGALHLPPGAGALNAVTSPAIDPVSKQAELKACAVRVEPVHRRPAGGGVGPREQLLVVGAGMAGLAAVEAVVEHDPSAFAVTIVGAEPRLPYNRVRLSQALAGKLAAPDLALRDRGWFAERGIEVRHGVAVSRLDLDLREAELADGDVLSWDGLVLATGSLPALPPIDGLQRTGVHAFRTLRDAEAIAAGAARGGRAIVIGGGLLGLEAARGLQVRGVRVTVVHLADRLMEQQLDGLAAALLERRIRELGIDVLLGTRTEAVVGNGRAEGVRLAGGQELDAELVVVATGVRPDADLARDAGLEVLRGIVVDDELRASHPGVWAVGECAEHRGTVYGLWPPVRRQARVAGAALAGRPAAFHGAVPATTLKVMGVDLFCAGHPEPGPGEEEIVSLDSRSGRYRKLVVAGDRLAGAVLIGDLAEVPALHDLIEHGRPIPSELLDGPPAEPGKPAPTAMVCSCNGVSREQIESAIVAGGLERVEQVAATTAATTGCGGCRPGVEALLAEARDRVREPLPG
jgi:anaerobic selenocysteine-containing dehydrogenase/NADPH-dependent 2,4-dienoyl-CoA reductase/sulfur reductase-like enzyme/bacterioferritin-associated ferredoxin